MSHADNRTDNPIQPGGVTVEALAFAAWHAQCNGSRGEFDVWWKPFAARGVGSVKHACWQAWNAACAQLDELAHKSRRYFDAWWLDAVIDQQPKSNDADAEHDTNAADAAKLRS